MKHLQKEIREVLAQHCGLMSTQHYLDDASEKMLSLFTSAMEEVIGKPDKYHRHRDCLECAPEVRNKQITEQRQRLQEMTERKEDGKDS